VREGLGMGSGSLFGRLMPIAMPAGDRAVRPRERMNSPRESRKVRLRGLGGPAACGVPRTCASAAGVIFGSSEGASGRPRLGRLKPRLQGHKVRLRGLGGPAACGVPRTCASAAGAIRRHPSIRNAESVIPRERRSALSRATNRGATEESTLGLLVTGRGAPALAATVRAGGLRVLPAANSFAPGGGLVAPLDVRFHRTAAGRERALTHSRTHALTHSLAGVAS
jgi:hypothetical protein